MKPTTAAKAVAQTAFGWSRKFGVLPYDDAERMSVLLAGQFICMIQIKWLGVFRKGSYEGSRQDGVVTMHEKDDPAGGEGGAAGRTRGGAGLSGPRPRSRPAPAQLSAGARPLSADPVDRAGRAAVDRRGRPASVARQLDGDATGRGDGAPGPHPQGRPSGGRPLEPARGDAERALRGPANARRAAVAAEQSLSGLVGADRRAGARVIARLNASLVEVAGAAGAGKLEDRGGN